MSVPRELRTPVAPQAYRISGGLVVVAFLALLVPWFWVAGLSLVLAAANLAFFRNPRRRIPAGEHCVVAPGDGRVVEVTKLDDPDGFVGPAWRIAIFLSIFDVHIQRVPLSGRVKSIRKKGSRFLAAFQRDASERNVQTRMDIEGLHGTRISVVQIVGLIARRIICYAGEGGTLVRGEPYGLICYGSRLEIYLPLECEIAVSQGERVKGGQTVIAEVRS
jgi:phosphatidylserine decarboxylase